MTAAADPRRLARSKRPRPLGLVQRIRLAARLAQHFADGERVVELPSPAPGSWRRLEARAALQRGRRAIGPPSPRALAELERRAQVHRLDFDAFLERLRIYVRRPPPPGVRDIYAELLALEEEFTEVEIDLAGKTLAVVTEPIALEDVELGRFRILLYCTAVEEAEYDVVALSPNEPSSSEFANVTHPHVRDDALCEGEGHEPIRAALIQGRLYDFFSIVDRTLKTYNPGSAYARLAEWQGVECQDCGCRTSEERILACGQCGDSSCFDCSRSCSECEQDLCAYCAHECPGCERRLCSDCLTSPPDAGWLCSDCHAMKENEHEEDEQEIDVASGPATGAASEPAIHALRLGEADVSA